jgi:NAD(P)-dependent dehydrogenase (short-subunit alcohol dehydrogenase family)
MQVHLMGTVKPCKALWETMKKQQYGRIVVTTSSTGLTALARRITARRSSASSAS